MQEPVLFFPIIAFLVDIIPEFKNLDDIFSELKIAAFCSDVLKCCVTTLVNSSLQFLNKMWILTCFYATSVLISQNYPTKKIFCQEVSGHPVLQFFKYNFSFI